MATHRPSGGPHRSNARLDRYLEEDSAVTVVNPRSTLYGYELYLVEQWPCSRQSPTLVISTYTGDQRHSIIVGVLAIPADEAAWSPRLRVFFKAIQQHHARPKDTPLGELMVTNLSSFPSAFTAIPVPEGDIRKYQKAFMVNENLKRMGCAGRSGLTLTDPTPATQAKFHQLYKVSERVPLFQAVLELVKLCQMALFLYGNLDPEFMDGLLCDVTETAIRNWWTDIGTEYYNVEPTDGILGPTTVAALLGTLMGARGRLHSYGANAPKDVFETDGMRRAITYFQKYQKLEKTGRLDRQSLFKLQTLTARAAAGEGWGVPRAVKSTMAEIGGKRGEIVMEMVSGRDKGGIGDTETTDIDKFISIVSGERAKWLWHGKPRRSIGMDDDTKTDDMTGMLARQETTSSWRTNGQSLPADEDQERLKKDDSPAAGYPQQAPPVPTIHSNDGNGERDRPRKAMFKSVAGKVSDARSGLGRIKDAVGGSRKTHGARPSMAGNDFASVVSPGGAPASPTESTLGPLPRAFTWRNKPEEYAGAFKKEGESGNVRYEPAVGAYQPGSPTLASPQSRRQSANGIPPDAPFTNIADRVRHDLTPSFPSEGDGLGPNAVAYRDGDQPICAPHRRHSIELERPSMRPSRDPNHWPRRLSFGDAEEAVLRWEEVADSLDLETVLDTAAIHLPAAYLEELVQSLNQKIFSIRRDVGPWTAGNLKSVSTLEARLSRQAEELRGLASQLADAQGGVQSASAELVAEERAALGEAVRDVEILVARLEYEMGALVSRVEDVEDGVLAYERQVEELEGRAGELRAQLETESWAHWAVRTLTGIGTGPN
ncbi:apolipoprotein A1/A4/E family protein, partial [Candidatus Bathyarchaeota archaeon]|nr:apolipoprotein A1/A4/E family protein [Candidatus Bathyarchaeota archaeon]